MYGEICRRPGDKVRSEKRRQRREEEYARQHESWFFEDFFVPDGLSAANISISERRDELERMLVSCYTWERALVRLRLRGITDVIPYAKVLGVTRSSLEEQRIAVERAWNRLRMKLRRLKVRHGNGSDSGD
jgi:hypothetical protein